ncbi:MAG: cytochrome c biogenesis protein CcsA [Methanosarcinales archaeon]
MVLENLTIGNLILYLAGLTSLAAIIGFVAREVRGVGGSDLSMGILAWLIRIPTILLTIDIFLLVYYFLAPDYTYFYVWEFSSRDLPFLYKISGLWAGQAGTYLLWTWFAFICVLWISKRSHLSSGFIRKVQLIALAIATYFVLLTIVQSPFELIYTVDPTLPRTFVPPDGSGMNQLLVNPWMGIHPPIVFIAYALSGVLFASAIVYLLTRDHEWSGFVEGWARLCWLFLTLGIALGGVWAYLVLGWGGFWSWDPVETASLIPWLTLTGFLHALSVQRRDKEKFRIAAPLLASLTFVLVIYAAMVTRSGLFNSVHAFSEAPTGTLLVLLLVITLGISLIIGVKRYLELPAEVKAEVEAETRVNRINIFYLTIILFVLLAFISLWGITFPVVLNIVKGVEVSIASDPKTFFNTLSYPVTLILLLALGFCLQYRREEREKETKILILFSLATVVAALFRTQDFYVLDHASPFFRMESRLYRFIGSASLFSLFPPLIYSLIGVTRYAQRLRRARKTRARVATAGTVLIHLAVGLILIGAITSTVLTTTHQASIPFHARGEVVEIGDGYGIRLGEIETGRACDGENCPGTRIATIYEDPAEYVERPITVSGRVTETVNVKRHMIPITYAQIDDGTGRLWIALEELEMREGITITASGILFTNFTSNATGRTFDLLLFTERGSIEEISDRGSHEKVHIEVYKDGSRIGSGSAKYVTGKGGSATYPLVDHKLAHPFTGDVYVIFQGLGDGRVPLTLKVIPAVNLIWIGVALFTIGILLMMIRERLK